MDKLKQTVATVFGIGVLALTVIVGAWVIAAGLFTTGTNPVSAVVQVVVGAAVVFVGWRISRWLSGWRRSMGPAVRRWGDASSAGTDESS